MEAQVATALAANDYQQVARLLKQWQQHEPQNPSLRLYAAKLQEQTRRLDAAESNYTKLLQQITHRKIIAQARAGIDRIHQMRADERQAALAKARAVEDGQAIAVLAIASPSPSHRAQA
ncbi:MAG: tetratricopeptide repeat protein, partial [Phormidesmis sp.]